jgi:hypothetical protein
MILSEQNLFSDKQDVNANAASTNVIDLGVAKDIGPGIPIPLLVQLTADATGTTPTLQVDVEVDDNDAFSSAKVVASYTFTGGLAGDQMPMQFVPHGVDERYARLNYTVGGTTPVYQVTAGITMGNQSNVHG